ncbi:MarR family winged helix-turn-helix transcriptional regulator [Methyloglobulus sp.]|uniref:MarR family winged helix-turn-helix transcriptional regulator n=1 Tax=Methyloglobulus sp. TaxID=2518622 RepID=UPI003988DA9C
MEKVTVFDVIERMSALIRSEERKKCTEFGLQSVHLQVLDYLSRCNKYSDTPAALTNYLGMTRGTVSQTLLLLEKKGYIKKTTDTVDRRVVHLSLLPEGKATLAKARPCELFNQASDLLQANELPRYDEALVTVLTALQKSNKSHSFGICKTCQFFTLLSDGYLCGLTKEPLTEEDSEKICQEHSIL